MLPFSVENLIHTLKEFLIVWINQILYYNDIYSQEEFNKFKSFDLIVYKSRNPILNEYIDEFLINFFHILLKKNELGKVYKLSIIIYNTNSFKQKIKYTFKLHDFIDLGEALPNVNFLHQDNASETILEMPNLTWNDIYNQFKTITFEHINELKKSHNTVDINNDNFFKIVLEINDSINLNTKEIGYNWVRINKTIDNPSKKIIRIDNYQNSIDFKNIDEVSLSVFSFDLHTEYVI